MGKRISSVERKLVEYSPACFRIVYALPACGGRVFSLQNYRLTRAPAQTPHATLERGEGVQAGKQATAGMPYS